MKFIDLLNEHIDKEGKYDMFAGLLIIFATYSIMNYVLNKLEIDKEEFKGEE